MVVFNSFSVTSVFPVNFSKFSIFYTFKMFFLICFSFFTWSHVNGKVGGGVLQSCHLRLNIFHSIPCTICMILQPKVCLWHEPTEPFCYIWSCTNRGDAIRWPLPKNIKFKKQISSLWDWKDQLLVYAFKEHYQWNYNDTINKTLYKCFSLELVFFCLAPSFSPP